MSACCAHRSRKLWGVSGFLRCTPMMKSPSVSGAERSAHENCGASPAACGPVMELADSLRLCAPPFTKLVTSQAACTPVIKSLTVAGSGHFLRSPLTHFFCWGTSQARCTPMMKIADRLRRCAPPSHARKLGYVSGSARPHAGDAASVHIKTHQSFALSEVLP